MLITAALARVECEWNGDVVAALVENDVLELDRDVSSQTLPSALCVALCGRGPSLKAGRCTLQVIVVGLWRGSSSLLCSCFMAVTDLILRFMNELDHVNTSKTKSNQ
ncbi:hypothetical protein EYF80_051063 [Liparis tanakae]|uniref:Uncharacterized protein n=1 Tax=Liparis tanakae TaxID=230148 RepID=A0A4Z2FCT5_9TELE|nr:hypothetical protein EYF80_051063 [Liparis tanakae]